MNATEPPTRARRPRTLAPLALLAAGLLAGACAAPEAEVASVAVVDDIDRVTPTPGATLRITGDVRLGRGLHVVAAPGEDGVLLLEGLDGVTVDLDEAELRGAAPGAALDRCTGRGIVVRDCRDVTIRGGRLGGFKVCVLVEDSERIVVEDVEFEGWYGMRLASTTAAEDPGDWLYPHENDSHEWRENYGAAVSITGGSGHVVRGCTGRKGQNGVLFTRVTGSDVHDNDFSFLSGWGFALYRSSENRVSHNAFDYCVRGYSDGVYWRGQDSAGILMFERCSRNLVAYNSATHCGDGVFLYAGQDLVEGRALRRGEEPPGGSDGNVFLGNDLRFAVANGLEATFSDDNVVLGNDLSGAHQHGVWGGYSARLVVLGNRIHDTRGGAVSIEHGQDCVIASNDIARNEVGVELWWDADPALVDGPLGAQRDTSSRDHWIVDNRFEENVLDLKITRTSGVVVHGNDWLPGDRETYVEGLSATDDPRRNSATLRAWLTDLEGRYPSGNLQAVSLTPWTGDAPDSIRAWSTWNAPPVPGDGPVRAEDRGLPTGGLETIVMGEFGPWDYRAGEPRPAQRRPGGALEDARWSATWFRWDPVDSDPRTRETEWRAGLEQPLATATVGTFSDPWGGDERVERLVGSEWFGLVATTQLPLERGGRYRLEVTSDDGVRVRVDGETAIEDWTHHAPQRDAVELELEAGMHEFEVEYFQIQGALALLVELTPLD